MVGNCWSESEDELVKAHYRTNLDTLVELLPCRSRHAIIQHAHRLGLWHRKWTDSEDDRIKQCYPQYGAEYCQQFMSDRSVGAIRDHAARLGVKRDLTRRRKPVPKGDWLEAEQIAYRKPWR